MEASNKRPDTLLVNVFNSEEIPTVYLDNRPFTDEAAAALARTLTAHDETEVLSMSNSGLTDSCVRALAEVLEKLSIKVECIEFSFPLT